MQGSAAFSWCVHVTAPAETALTEGDRAACRLGVIAAAGTLFGIVVSGPLAVWLVSSTHPQPAWSGPQQFVRHFHPVQIAPYPGGIVLVAAVILLIASLHALARPAQRALANAALIACAVFASLVFINYTVQFTVIPVLVHDYDSSQGPLLSALCMANPRSMAWALEMWGWGLFGVSSWLMAGVFDVGRAERAARIAFIANGPVSVAGALWMVVTPGWTMTDAGLVLFALWNVLLAVMASLSLVALRARLAAGESRTSAADSRRHSDTLPSLFSRSST